MTRKLLRTLLWSVASGIVLAVALLIYLANAGLGVFEDPIESLISSAMGHEFAIDGRSELRFGATSRIVAERVSLRRAAEEPDGPQSVGAVRVRRHGAVPVTTGFNELGH